MINKKFIEDTDQIIDLLGERKISFEHGNVLIAKVRVDRITASGLHLADDYANREEFKSGFARILALPTSYEGPLKVGAYGMFSHEARYPLYPLAIREIIGIEVEKELLYVVQDHNFILTVSSEIMEGKREYS